jgi:predicted  nucleic acid-binding Zn-ribbon protein
MTNSNDVQFSESDIASLIQLQALSTRIVKNALRLSAGPQSGNYRDKALAYKRLKSQLDSVLSEVEALKSDQRQVEEELVRFNSELDKSKKMLSNSSQKEYRFNPKLQLQISELDSKVTEYTEAEIAIIEKLEVLEKKGSGLDIEVKGAYREAAIAKAELDKLKSEVEKVASELNVELDALRSSLSSVVVAALKRVPADVIDKVSLLVEGSCGGCRLRFSSSLAEKIRRSPISPNFCEECGRIVVLG